MARDLAIVAAVYLLFCGYVFREEYFRQFGLPTIASIADSLTFFVYGYRVFIDEFGWKFFFVGILLLGIFLILRRFATRMASPREVAFFDRIALIVVLLAAFPILANLSASAARQEAGGYKRWTSLNGLLTLGVRDDFRRTASRTVAGRVFLKSIDSHEMRLFGLTDDAAYIADEKYDINNQPSNLLIYIIPRNEIMHMELSFSNVSK